MVSSLVYPTTMISHPEAFELFTISNVALAGPGLNPTAGLLHLEGVSVPAQTIDPNTGATVDTGRHVYLVLRLNSFEMPIDPSCIVTRTDEPKGRVYRFTETHADPHEFTLSISGPFAPGDDTTERLETLEAVLEEYVSELRYAGPGVVAVEPLTAQQANAVRGAVDGDKDLRGHLVMINEDTGEVVGQVEDRFRIREDAALRERGHENDPVVIHVPDDYTRESDRHALEAFATVIPPEERNWISNSANIVSHAISMTTNLLITTITTGASYYMKHSNPTPQQTPSTSTASTSAARSKDATSADSNTPPPLPPRFLQYLTSEKTRQNLSTVHSLSGQAVKVSAKTVGLIDGMIRRAMGAKPKRQKYFPRGIPPSGASTLAPGTGQQYSRSPSPRLTSPSPGLAPPAYAAGGNGSGKTGAYPQDKPPLPPRRSPSPGPLHAPVAMPAPVFNGAQPQGTPPPLPQRKLKTKDHLLISADLILSTIDDSARRMLDVGTEQFGRVMGHKYGPEAKESSLYMAGTARNVGLVYIDMSGIGRRALLKRAGKTFLKARLSSTDPVTYPPPNTPPLPLPITPRQ